MDHSPRCWSGVFFPLPKRLFAIIVSFSYIYILQGSVEMHLWCGGICNNHIPTNCPQSVPVKKNWKLVDKVKWHVFMAHGVHRGHSFPRQMFSKFRGPVCQISQLTAGNFPNFVHHSVYQMFGNHWSGWTSSVLGIFLLQWSSANCWSSWSIKEECQLSQKPSQSWT